jgi:protein-S-isoprenylcysteine O-methyltransferase Ste14
MNSIAIGSALLIPGILLRALASGYVKKNEALTVSGPYAYTRNPLYLGSLILAAGFCVAARSWVVVVILLCMFVFIYVPVIRSEEAFLRERFPEFADYSRHVRRLLPRVTAYGRSDGSFSWVLYQKHREYNAVLGSVAMMAILAAKVLWMARRAA